MTHQPHVLRRDENQARGLGQYAIDLVAGRFPGPSARVLEKVEQFHRDAVACAVSALALAARAPTVLRQEALRYVTGQGRRAGATCFGSTVRVMPEKAVLANCAAVREWDANGTNFGYDPSRGATAGEFGHNDYYAVVMAAAQQVGADGRLVARAMVCLDEIRGRLAEVFALKDHKIDHVLHGGVACAAVYGAMRGATAAQIESAIGQVVAHHVPFRAIRAGSQLSDSKGAAAAICAEAAVVSVHRALQGFVGPADIFRNPQAIFCLFEPPPRAGTSPFDLALATAGDDFAVLGMHFKLGLYEHQSAGAIEGLMTLLEKRPEILDSPGRLRAVRITIYEPAYSIIGDPSKRDPPNRQTADHSMVYIVATLLRKAYETRQTGWRQLMLMPEDYSQASLQHELTRRIMAKIHFQHGGAEFDARYPEGIPTTLELEHADLGSQSSGLVMFPTGHARHHGRGLESLLGQKFSRLAADGVDDPESLSTRLAGLAGKSAAEIDRLYDFPIRGLPPAGERGASAP